ncbi:hypothetical protein GUITHDRAFT_99950 [Guillardia theta CCMP2712]|uniref:Uncharacterized protein n=1 Tax=Guillardia theta (strain CCMP2712) TaxID=905079 RepID=L1K1Y9_GUITC|nr:hypothetical protein GUITHDRAFT_99950 [Guillardia theta CCMP2712]EKX54470.1 hypothetical protein GUITHDRAFT_99950 [Guillardia theta CCMP2712]|eukprot:XP_005841450.1 hypothetical protein GUITHDRAFT_99950 [Guillardia theta CCMP2712]
MMCSNGGIELALTSITFRRTLADRNAMEIAVEHLSIAVSLRKMSEDGRLQDPILRLERVCPAAVQGEDITLLIGQRSASMHMAREDAHDKRSHIALRRRRNEVLMRQVDESAQTKSSKEDWMRHLEPYHAPVPNVENVYSQKEEVSLAEGKKCLKQNKAGTS